MGVVLGSTLVITDNPASTPWIGWHNIVTAGNIATTTSTSGFPATNMANPATHLRWIGGANTADEFITVTITNDSPPLQMNYIAVAVHNWGTLEIPVSVEGLNLTDSPAGWHALVAASVPDDDCPLLFRFQPEVLQSIRIKLAVGDSGIPPYAAVVYVGQLLICERSIEIEVDHTPITMGRRSTIMNGMSESGNFLGRIVTNTFQESQADFAWFTPAWYRANFIPFIRAVNDQPFFFAWHPISYPAEVGYAWLTEDPQSMVHTITQRIGVQLKYRGVSC